MARATEQTLDGVRGGERSLETLRQTQADTGEQLTAVVLVRLEFPILSLKPGRRQRCVPPIA